MAFIKVQYLFMHNKNSKKSSNIWELPQPDKRYTSKPTNHHSLYTNILDIFSFRSEIFKHLHVDSKKQTHKNTSELWLLGIEDGKRRNWRTVVKK